MRTTKVNRVADESVVSYIKTDLLSDKVIQEVISIGINLNLSNEIVGNYLMDTILYPQVIEGSSIEDQLKNYKVGWDKIQESEDFN